MGHDMYTLPAATRNLRIRDQKLPRSATAHLSEEARREAANSGMALRDWEALCPVDCMKPSGHIGTHSRINLNRMQADHGDMHGGTCADCYTYGRKPRDPDYRWYATILIVEWP